MGLVINNVLKSQMLLIADYPNLINMIANYGGDFSEILKLISCWEGVGKFNFYKIEKQVESLTDDEQVMFIESNDSNHINKFINDRGCGDLEGFLNSLFQGELNTLHFSPNLPKRGKEVSIKIDKCTS
jgi:hypothetical protein